ncbi:cytochrome P450 4C1-like [Anoplophora glabripennis]|uniref:Cytochrome P450 n=1 Tax=Anoplophora glabripennis TaxID=217634 RepID=A0A8F8QQU8_ANOGL|nr:cytochrome P450 4C1-like [Anoplophora glabripennis]QYA71962.1 cytochrome P450 [Anoplophora glabripennis]
MVFSAVIAFAEKAFVGLSCFLCFVVILVLCDLVRKRRIFKFARDFKGYRFYPVFGNGYYTIGKDIFSVIENLKKEHGLPCNLWNGHDYHYVTADASEVKVVLNHPSTFDKGAIYDNIKIAFEKSILLAKYDQWKRNRKIYSRSFSQPILNSFVDVFYDKACILVEILKKSHERDVYDVFCRLSLDNFCANVMGLDLDVQRIINDRLVPLIDRLQTGAGKRMFTSYFIPTYLYFFTPAGRSMLRNFLEIREFIYNTIQQKRQVFKKEKDFRENSNKLPLMDMMLEAEGKIFSDEDIFQEIVLFLLAAMDTSGVTLSFAFTLFGMNPEAQEKIYQEVNQTVGWERPICYSDLPNLKYTERAIFEAMRLLPVTPAIERYAATDVDLGDKKIPAGTNILISVFNLHRSETYWKNPLEFNPDRFLPEEVAERHPYAFIPFSGGPRNCIGMKYALMMMKTTVAHVIRNYEIKSKHKSVTDMDFESFITMKTLHELDCTFIPRCH